jgi:hypothetical protein
LKIHGAGQWLEEKHGAKSHRGWRKLHLALDADSGEVIAHSLTDQDTSDGSPVEPLFGQIEDEMGQFTGDGAYDADPTYIAVLRHGVQAKIVIPPRSTAVARQDAEPPNQRDCHVASIQAASFYFQVLRDRLQRSHPQNSGCLLRLSSQQSQAVFDCHANGIQNGDSEFARERRGN